MGYLVGVIGLVLAAYSIWLQTRANRRQEQFTGAFRAALEKLALDSKGAYTEGQIEELTTRLGTLEAQIKDVPAQARRVFLQDRRQKLAESIGDLYEQYVSVEGELSTCHLPDALDELVRASLEHDVVPQYAARQRQQRYVYTGIVIMVAMYLFPTLGSFITRLLRMMASGIPIAVSTDDIISYVGGFVVFSFLAFLIPGRRLAVLLPYRAMVRGCVFFSLAAWFGLVSMALNGRAFMNDAIVCSAIILTAAAWFIGIAAYMRRTLGPWTTFCIAVTVSGAAVVSAFKPLLSAAFPHSQLDALASLASLVMLAYCLRLTHYLLWTMRRKVT